MVGLCGWCGELAVRNGGVAEMVIGHGSILLTSTRVESSLYFLRYQQLEGCAHDSLPPLSSGP